MLAIMGILDALILSFLAFVLGNRQTDFYLDDLQTDNKGEWKNNSLCFKLLPKKEIKKVLLFMFLTYF